MSAGTALAADPQHLAPQWHGSETCSAPKLLTETSGMREMPYIGAVQHGSHWLQVATELLKCAED